MQKKADFLTIQNILFFGLLIGVTGLFVWLVSDYLSAIFWAVVFAIVFFPLYERWEKKLRYKSLASLITILTVVVIIIAPLSILGPLVVQEGISLFEAIGSADNSQALPALVEAINQIPSLSVTEEDILGRLQSAGTSLLTWFSGQALSIGQATFSAIIQFFVMIYLLFFLLRGGRALTQKLMAAFPLGDERERFLFQRFCAITRAIFRGTLVIAAIQGAIGGILFLIVGIEGALVWGVLMALLSVIPAVGPGVIWLPAAILLYISGDIVGGTILLFGGGVVISLTDNFLRPVLVGKGAHMPDALVLLATLGGLAVFGIAGFVVGPIIAGFFLALWEIFTVDYQTELEHLG